MCTSNLHRTVSPALLFLLASCGVTVAEPSGVGATGVGGSTASMPSGTSGTGGTGGACPDPFPGVLAPCAVEGQVCTVPQSCCDVQVTCAAGRWAQPTAPTCHELCTAPCDGNAMSNGAHGFACAGDDVCVVAVHGLSPIETLATYQCATSPCPPGGLACSCAAPLCPGGFVCAATTEPSTVTCHPQ